MQATSSRINIPTKKAIRKPKGSANVMKERDQSDVVVSGFEPKNRTTNNFAFTRNDDDINLRITSSKFDANQQ